MIFNNEISPFTSIFLLQKLSKTRISCKMRCTTFPCPLTAPLLPFPFWMSCSISKKGRVAYFNIMPEMMCFLYFPLSTPSCYAKFNANKMSIALEIAMKPFFVMSFAPFPTLPPPLLLSTPLPGCSVRTKLGNYFSFLFSYFIFCWYFAGIFEPLPSLCLPFPLLTKSICLLNLCKLNCNTLFSSVAADAASFHCVFFICHQQQLQQQPTHSLCVRVCVCVFIKLLT